MSRFQEKAKGLIDRGYETMSNLASSAGDVASKTKIKAKLLDVSLEQDNLMKKLGYAVYDDLVNDDAFRAANEELLARIADVIAHKEALETELADMDASEDDADIIDVDAIVVNEDANASAGSESKANEGEAE